MFLGIPSRPILVLAALGSTVALGYAQKSTPRNPLLDSMFKAVRNEDYPVAQQHAEVAAEVRAHGLDRGRNGVLVG